MSGIRYPEAPVRPRLGPARTAERARKHLSHAEGRNPLALASVPLIISGGVHLVFFISWWLPESADAPLRDWLLNQLALLSSRWLTSEGHTMVINSDHWWELPAITMLIAAIAIPMMIRSRHWLNRVLLWAAAALGAVLGLTAVIAAIGRAQFGSSFLSVVLIGVWVWAAFETAIRSVHMDPEAIPARTLRERLPSLLIFAALAPAPIAVGRWLFGPELRAEAVQTLGDNGALRLAALATPASFGLYLCGVGIAALIWLGRSLLPPRKGLPPLRIVAIMVGLAVIIGLIGWGASGAALHRARELRGGNPVKELHFTCGAWVIAGSGPVRTVVVSGLSCSQVTFYRGYQQTHSLTLTERVSPMHARTPQDTAITGKLAAAQYEDILLIAASSRFDAEPNQMIAIDLNEGRELWSAGCPDEKAFRLRFAGVPTGENIPLGHITEVDDHVGAVLVCTSKTLQLDPRTGHDRG